MTTVVKNVIFHVLDNGTVRIFGKVGTDREDMPRKNVDYPYPVYNTKECPYEKRYELLELFAETWVKDNILNAKG